MFLKDLNKEKLLIDKEISLYRREQELQVARNLHDYIDSLRSQRSQAEKEIVKFECEWHNAKEKKQVELAQLEGKLNALQVLDDQMHKALEAKDAAHAETMVAIQETLTSLQETVTALAENINGSTVTNNVT